MRLIAVKIERRDAKVRDLDVEPVVIVAGLAERAAFAVDQVLLAGKGGHYWPCATVKAFLPSKE